MAEIILGDPKQFPTADIIFSHIGETRNLWETMFRFIHENYPDFSEEWRFYKDGNSWLLKVVRKSKTIFWLSVLKDAFRVTFYFTDRAESTILASTIPEHLKHQFATGKRYNKIRGLSVTVNKAEDVEDVKSLISIKLMIK